MLELNSQEQIAKISTFIEETLRRANRQNVIIAASGGIDSTTSLYLLHKTLQDRNIYVVHLYYFENSIEKFKKSIAQLQLPQEHVLLYPIADAVDTIAKTLQLNPQNDTEKLRLGNIMARVRMTMLFDLAKKHHALVCGTENRSEYHLGYFTRYGDEGSDFEPIQHLYKTQVLQLAASLGVPESARTAPPSAGLWEDQTDQSELGFSYEEADPVLKLYFDEKHSLQEIKERGYSNVKTIIETALGNKFKHEVPYRL